MIKPLLKTAYYFEHGFDKARWKYRRKFNRIGPLILMVYRGMGNHEKAYINGRLTEDRHIRPARQEDGRLQNLHSMFKRFKSNEIPGAGIQAEFFGERYETRTDGEGYFEFEMKVPSELDKKINWHEVNLTLLDKIGKNEGPVSATGYILIPQSGAEYGVISDVDDTVIQTSATSFIRMIWKTFLYNASTRLPFEGVAGFYRALHRGSQTRSIKNPLYYVSSSPWNLYDMLEDFWEIQKLPPGPFMLRDLGLNPETLLSSGHHSHKLAQIEKIFKFTGDLPFILIGDSGQHDPEIYMEVVRNHPGRILAVYIRDVTKVLRDKEVYSMTDEMQSLGTEMIYVKDTEVASRHAISRNFIQPADLEEVKEEKRKDKALKE